MGRTKSTRRADGRLVRAIVDPRTGKRKYFYGKTEREINAQIMSYTSDAERGRTFSQVAAEWWDRAEERLAIQSVNTYDCARRRAVSYFGDALLKDITPKKIRAFLLYTSQKGYAQKTVATQRMIVNQIMTHGVLEGDIEVNPCTAVATPKDLPRTKRTSATADDERIIRETTDGWLFPFFALMTGMRRGEILALQWCDIDFAKNLIFVTKSVAHKNNAPIVKSPKTEAGRRVVPLLPQLRERLEQIDPRPARHYIFSTDGKTPLTNMQFSKLLEEYHNETGTTFTAHQLRHSFATNAFEAGVSGKSVQEIIGHRQLATTMDMYTDFRADALNEAAAQLAAAAEKKP